MDTEFVALIIDFSTIILTGEKLKEIEVSNASVSEQGRKLIVFLNYKLYPFSFSLNFYQVNASTFLVHKYVRK